MKYLNLDDMKENKLNSILKREKQYIYDYELKATHFTADANMIETLDHDIKNWLKNNAKGRFKYIAYDGFLWGISFQKKHDLMLFKLVWS